MAAKLGKGIYARPIPPAMGKAIKALSLKKLKEIHKLPESGFETPQTYKIDF